MAANDLPMYSATDFDCWSFCPDKELCIGQSEQSLGQINGDPTVAGGVGVIERTRPECEMGPVLFLGELVCGANIDPKSLI